LGLGGCRWLTNKTLRLVAENCKKLKKLYVYHFKTADDSVFESFANNCQELEVLHLYSAGLATSAGMQVLSKLTNLRVLNLKRCPITDDVLWDICQSCSKLMVLNLNGCVKLTNRGLDAITAHLNTQLNKLGLSHTHVSDVTLQELTICSNLKSLMLENVEKLTEFALDPLIKALTNLEALDITGARSKNDPIRLIGRYCTNLKSLRMEQCSRIHDVVLIQVLRGCTQLERLCVNGLKNITDASVKVLAENCTQLVDLETSGCLKLTDESVIEVAKNCTRLFYLNLSQCRKITDAAIEAICEHLTNLKTINLSQCPNVSPQAVNALQVRYPRCIIKYI
jgi:Leucine-rich repeat (LRR) protein